jgi:SH3-like domain-containing protein
MTGVVAIQVTAVLLILFSGAAAAQSPAESLPRFASLKAQPVDVRRGPSAGDAPLWTFQRAGVPIEVLAIEGAFARVRDVEGGQGWVPASVLSARRTAMVISRDNERTTLRADRRAGASAVAELEGGQIAGVSACDGGWCLLTIGTVRGYAPQDRLWGVYPGETLD